jgi:hypothetical protein
MYVYVVVNIYRGGIVKILSSAKKAQDTVEELWKQNEGFYGHNPFRWFTIGLQAGLTNDTGIKLLLEVRPTEDGHGYTVMIAAMNEEDAAKITKDDLQQILFMAVQKAHDTPETPPDIVTALEVALDDICGTTTVH